MYDIMTSVLGIRHTKEDDRLVSTQLDPGCCKIQPVGLKGWKLHMV